MAEGRSGVLEALGTESKQNRKNKRRGRSTEERVGEGEAVLDEGVEPRLGQVLLLQAAVPRRA
jgi:hypothetical protein